MKQKQQQKEKKKKKKKGKKKQSTVNAYIDIKAFHTHTEIITSTIK